MPQRLQRSSVHLVPTNLKHAKFVPGASPRAFLHMKTTLFLSFLLLAFACKKQAVVPVVPQPGQPFYDWSSHQPFTTNYGVFNMPFTTVFEVFPSEQGPVSLSEASGLAYSRSNPGKLWAHNDSGHPNTLFLIDTATAEIVASFRIVGTANIDWEDIEIANGPVAGKHYLYLGDTGDNEQRRPEYDIYRFEEPVYDSMQHHAKVNVVDDIQVDRIRFMFPDKSHDTEALFVDPQTLDIYLATKRDVHAMLFVLPYPQRLNQPYSCFHVGDFSFRAASAGTVSRDGNRILIKNRQDIFYWERMERETLWQALSRTPVRAPYVGEPQGEAICFDDDFNYYTLSEALNNDTPPLLYKYYLRP